MVVDPEKPAQTGLNNNNNNGNKPDKAHIPTSKYNTRERDLEANVVQSPSVLASNYGINPSDQPSHPPRRVTSSRSLRHGRSQTSLRSQSFSRNGSAINFSLADAPPLPTSSHQYQQQQLDNTYNTGEGQVDGQDDEADLDEELAWGPSHPCFPHMNSHVPINSPEYTTTRIIRIRRDWMIAGDQAPTFSNIYPEILDPLMPEQEFRFVIQYINTTLLQAYNPFSPWNWFDGLIGLLTGWFWEDFRHALSKPSFSIEASSGSGIGVKSKLSNLEKWIESWNHQVGARDGIKIIPLRRTGYMNLDIQIPDPQVRVVNDDHGEGDGEGGVIPQGGGGEQQNQNGNTAHDESELLGRPGTALENDSNRTASGTAGISGLGMGMGIPRITSSS